MQAPPIVVPSTTTVPSVPTTTAPADAAITSTPITNTDTKTPTPTTTLSRTSSTTQTTTYPCPTDAWKLDGTKLPLDVFKASDGSSLGMELSSLDVDPKTGYVFACGYTLKSVTFGNYTVTAANNKMTGIVIKMDTIGKVLWARGFNASGNGYSRVNCEFSELGERTRLETEFNVLTHTIVHPPFASLFRSLPHGCQRRSLHCSRKLRSYDCICQCLRYSYRNNRRCCWCLERRNRSPEVDDHLRFQRQKFLRIGGRRAKRRLDCQWCRSQGSDQRTDVLFVRKHQRELSGQLITMLHCCSVSREEGSSSLKCRD